MRTVGQILKKARIEKKLSVDDISVKTKINSKYIRAIEKNDYQRLPPAAFTKGFVQNYAKIVDLNPHNILAIFRRDYDQDEQGKIIPRGIEKPVQKRVNFFTPKTTTFTITLVISGLIALFFLRQIFILLSAPPLQIQEPQDNITTTSPVIVSGSTKPEATITINNKPIKVDDQGNFATQIELTAGEHTLVITATNRSGKSRSIQRLVDITSQ